MLSKVPSTHERQKPGYFAPEGKGGGGGGGQGYNSGESTSLSFMQPGFDSRAHLQIWAEFVVGSR